MIRLNIFDIKRYAINDGPGIRTTVFFCGCPLRCVWCHNPESWDYRTHKVYKQAKCIGCRSCLEACPRHAIAWQDGIVPVEGVECLRCGRCADACPTLALEMCGREWTVDELMGEIEKERDVMEDSGGGVTLCGGEPLFQPDGALALLSELGRRRLHRAVDTTLYASARIVAGVAAHCELMLVDLKMMDGRRHRQLTGVDNRLILDNIRLVASMGKPFFIRIPFIEGVNTDEQNIRQTAQFLQSLDCHDTLRGINLLPFHDVGREKHRRMWSAYNPENVAMSVPSDEVVEHALQLFAAHGLAATVGG